MHFWIRIASGHGLMIQSLQILSWDSEQMKNHNATKFNFERYPTGKSCQEFFTFKSNEGERWITVAIYNDTCSATLGRTSSLARRLVGEASFLCPQAAVWCRNLGSTRDKKKLRHHFSTTLLFIWKCKNELFICFYCFPTLTLSHKNTHLSFPKCRNKNCFKIIGKNSNPLQ